MENLYLFRRMSCCYRLPVCLFAHERDVAIPTRLEAHLFAEDSRAQFIFLAEVYESNAGALQSLDKLHHVTLRLVLHRHHANEHLERNIF